MKPAVICLYDLDSLALIVKCRTGVLYHNQVGGTFCLQEKIEGALIPLPASPGRSAEYALFRHFQHFPGRLDSPGANIVDGILRRNGLGFLNVDHAHLGNSWEAWIHVQINQETAQDLFEAEGWEFGILTWPNSD